MANITEAEIRKIVENIVKGASGGSAKSYTPTEYNGRRLIGIYDDMNDAIDAAERGYRAEEAQAQQQFSSFQHCLSLPMAKLPFPLWCAVPGSAG